MEGLEQAPWGAPRREPTLAGAQGAEVVVYESRMWAVRWAQGGQGGLVKA